MKNKKILLIVLLLLMVLAVLATAKEGGAKQNETIEFLRPVACGATVEMLEKYPQLVLAEDGTVFWPTTVFCPASPADGDSIFWLPTGRSCFGEVIIFADCITGRIYLDQQ